jgi:hypothetical protein
MDNSKVVELKSTQTGNNFKFPSPIGEVLDEYNGRVREALAVARLLSEHLTSPPGFETDEDVAMLAADAIVRLLDPVDGINCPHDLKIYAKARGLVEDKSVGVTNG